MSKVYTVSDLFFTAWAQLNERTHAEVYALLLQLKELTPSALQASPPTGGDKAGVKYGLLLIQILRRLRKNPRLVARIDVEQAVDIFNDLKFLSEPWYFFPSIKKLPAPDEKLARHTFDHFIYADNEYSSFLSNKNVTHLRRLVATLYQASFDKENVEPIADNLKAKEWQLTLTFWTYAQVREFVAKRCKTLMPPPIPHLTEEGDAGTGPASVQPTGAMWLKLKHRLAETPAFQGYDKAGRANMYAALDYLEDLAQQKENAKH